LTNHRFLNIPAFESAVYVLNALVLGSRFR